MYKYLLKTLSSVALLMSCWQAYAAPITYKLAFKADFENIFLFGTITLNDGVRSSVTEDEIAAWSFFGHVIPVSSTDDDTETICHGDEGCFLATPTKLLFDFGSTEAYFGVSSTFCTDPADPEYCESHGVDFSGSDFLGGVWWSIGAEYRPSQAFPPVLTVVGVGNGESVPEPGAGMLLCMAATAAYFASCKGSRNRPMPCARHR